MMRRADPRFPIGRSRLEAVGVVACAVIMVLATIEVIQSSAEDLWDGFQRGEDLCVCGSSRLALWAHQCSTTPRSARTVHRVHELHFPISFLGPYFANHDAIIA